jgi:hypothetical protein
MITGLNAFFLISRIMAKNDTLEEYNRVCDTLIDFAQSGKTLEEYMDTLRVLQGYHYVGKASEISFDQYGRPFKQTESGKFYLTRREKYYYSNN